MSLHITRCPGCGTSFNTSDSVLDSAGGRVRCGACLTVFEARKYLLQQRHSGDEGRRGGDGNDDEAKSVFVSPPTEFFDPSGFLRPRSSRQRSGGGGLDAAMRRRPMGDEAATSADGAGASSATSAASPSAQSSSPAASSSSASATPSSTKDRKIALPEAVSLPLEFLLRRRGRGAGMRLLSSLTALLLMLALVAQFLWVERQTYSQNASLRGFYERVCGWYGSSGWLGLLLGEGPRDCGLPPFADFSAIECRNAADDILESGGVATLNIILRNTASFPQPFPLVILEFSTRDGRSVALRQFAPEEYLPEALRHIQTMPVMNPVQFQMDVIHPGPDAVNYTFGCQPR